MMTIEGRGVKATAATTKLLVRGELYHRLTLYIKGPACA